MKTRELWAELPADYSEFAKKQFLAHPTRADKRMQKDLVTRGTIYKQIQQMATNRARRIARRTGMN